MKRKIIEIDEARCDGCGQCIDACHEGALALVGGKARLVKDVYCDGLGACVGDCPTGALTVIEREALPFDAALVATRAAAVAPTLRPHGHGAGGCPGSALRVLQREPPEASGSPGPSTSPDALMRPTGPATPGAPASPAPPSALGHWPVQLMLVPPQASFLAGSDLLVCADCVPFAVPDFHARFLAGRAVVVGCPKLDDLEHYRAKLTAMVGAAQPRRLTVARMEVPCCRAITQATVEAARASAPGLAVEEHVVGVRGGVERGLIGPAAPATRG